MNKVNIDKLIAFLNNLDDKRFNFQQVISKFNKEHNCGTVCCAIGWFPKIFPERIGYTFNGDVASLSIDGHVDDYPSIASELLDIPELHCQGLFTPWDEDYEEDYDALPIDEYIAGQVSDYDLPTGLVLCDAKSSPKEVAYMLGSYVQLMSIIPDIGAE